MYKLLLCLKYLRTRYLAFVCIVSVMLGVATLIVVNGVMSGFSTKLKDRLHGLISDVNVETERADGFAEMPQAMAARIAASPAGQSVEAVSPTVEVFALFQFHVRTRNQEIVPITKHVRLIGVDPVRHAKVGRFAEYLVRQKNAAAPNFELSREARERLERNQLFNWDQPAAEVRPTPPGQPRPGDFLQTTGIEVPDQPPALVPPPVVPLADPPRVTGVIVGYSIAHTRYKDPKTGENLEIELLKPGDDVFIATVGANGTKPVSGTCVVADYFRSEMSEYDSSFVYMPLDELQRMRGMDGRVNALQVKLKGDLADDGRFVHEKLIPELQSLFPPSEARVVSWQQHQGPLLAAIDIERGILNLLLFMIVGVAGFSVLAIFTMIVSEKFRDIGVLKSLGASNRGVMGIFLSYGLLLAVIGSALGTGVGLAITENINEIEGWLTRRTGQQIFDRSVYYFDKIPTNVEPLAVTLINVGAVGTAVLFSVLPAWRAARLHPVRALRFE
ncbi:MAG TPA: FtsX-like permease family protein [Fimbriiglobus sp.]|nr:FtsX-like permease family protein [Fimbriiglobus sp.]